MATKSRLALLTLRECPLPEHCPTTTISKGEVDCSARRSSRWGLRRPPIARLARFARGLSCRWQPRGWTLHLESPRLGCGFLKRCLARREKKKSVEKEGPFSVSVSHPVGQCRTGSPVACFSFLQTCNESNTRVHRSSSLHMNQSNSARG